MLHKCRGVLPNPQGGGAGQGALSQHIGDGGHQIKHGDRHAGESAVDKCRKVLTRCQIAVACGECGEMVELHVSQTAHHGDQIQQRGEVGHQRSQCHGNHDVQQTLENLAGRCRRIRSGRKPVPLAQTAQDEVQPANGGGQCDTQYGSSCGESCQRNVCRNQHTDLFRMGQHPPAQQQPHCKLCHCFRRLRNCRRCHGLQTLPVAPLYRCQTAKQCCRRNGEHGENGIGLLGDLTGERFRQQQDAAAQQESQNTARQQGGTPDAAHLFPPPEGGGTGDGLGYGGGKTGDRECVYRQQQPVGGAEISHAGSAQHVGEGNLEACPQNLGEHGRDQQNGRPFPKCLLFQSGSSFR